MCGITGYIGYKPAVAVLLGALKKLEYRGYDSAGIAVLHEGELTVRKAKGALSVLSEKIARETIPGTLGIGHTRWATHGEPSDVNAHPQTDSLERIGVVHNGIIENSPRLKDWLQGQGVMFRSDTDTEVIAHLIRHYYRETEDSLLQAVLETLRRLEGSYALAVTCADFPDRIVAARKDNPLVVGLGNGENFVASDVPALIEHTREVCYLEDKELAVLYRDRVDFFSDLGEKRQCRSRHVDWDVAAAEKGGYPHFMLKEIHEQTKSYLDTVRPRISGGEVSFPELKGLDLKKVKRVVLVGCGTAWHAAMVGKFAFEHFARIPAEVDIASEYRYRDPISQEGDLFVVISQSGETADTLAAMRLVKKAGGKVAALTNVVGSTAAREADYVINTLAGPEIAVASTKAFTTQMACIYLLSLQLGKAKGTVTPAAFEAAAAALLQAGELTAQVLLMEETIQKFAYTQCHKTKVFFIGRQADYCAALESALKLKEIAYIHSEAFAAGELKHGPIALVDSATLVVALCTQTGLFDKMASAIQQVAARGASTLAVTWEGTQDFAGIADTVLTLPKIEDALSPLLSIIPSQLFAYYCSIQRGNDPDKPRNLAKSVTVE